jgi:ech hydrogenase subunit A
MLPYNWMMAVAILLPVVAAILVFVIRQYHVRGVIVILAAIALIVNSVLFLLHGADKFTPVNTQMWDMVVTVLDYLILLFYIYVGISLKNWLVLIFALAQIIPLAWFEFGMNGSAALAQISPTFVVDHLAIVMCLVISIVGSLICVFAIRYMYDHEHHQHLEKSRQSRFLFWLVLFLGAMNGLVFSNNLIYLYFFWEVTTLVCFQLIAHDLTKEAIGNAARALWLNSIGGFALIIAMILLLVNGGPNALSLASIINSKYTSLSSAVPAALLILPVALMCLTGMIKAAQLPFQSWLLGAMVAPTPVSALLHSSTMVKAGVYLVLRLAPAFAGTKLSIMVALVGAFTFMAASGLAISQTTGKRVLAYSTIANLGLIIACAGINTPLAITAAILLIIFHAVSKGLMFLCAGTIEHIVWSREIEDMEGLAAKAPMVTTITAIGVLSMFLPPFGMLLGKWMALESASVIPLAAWMFVIASAATIVFWAKWLGRLLQVLPKLGSKIESLSLSYTAPLWLLVVGIFGVGIGVAPILTGFVQNAVADVITSGQAVVAQGWGLEVNGVSAVSGAANFAVGNYPVWPLFIAFAIAVLIPFIFVAIKPGELRPVYMCGEQAGGTDTDEWYSTADVKTKVQLGGYYYKGVLGEAALNPWTYTLSIVLLVIMFAVALLAMGGAL